MMSIDFIRIGKTLLIGLIFFFLKEMMGPRHSLVIFLLLVPLGSEPGL